jgi:tRNA (guanine37-N1)-methyltransferase
MLSDFLQVKKKDAEKIKTKLIENNIYVFNLKPLHDDYFVYFPISNKKIAKKYGKIFRKSSKEYEKRTISLKDILTKMKLNLSQIKSITSYDTVGAIAILKITDDLIPYEKEIAESLLKTNPSLKTIVKKTKEHHGVYRVQSVKWLAGKRTFLTYVKEAGAIFKVKVGDMFFSPRLSFERLRIANLVKPHSNVAVFFQELLHFQ